MKFRPGVVPQWPSSRGLMCFSRERLAEQRIVEQIDLADREVIGRPPVGVHLPQQVGRQGIIHIPSRFKRETDTQRSHTTVRAIIDSSSVRMTRTTAPQPSAEISGSFAALRASSRRTPRNPRSAQMRERTSAAFSPMPPAKTRASSPPSAAVMAPIHFLA